MKSQELTSTTESKARTSVPDHVQIQTVTGCNAHCIFCPNGKTELEIPRGRRMDWDLYRSIVDQSIALGVRRYSPYLMNEPMLDRELPQRIEYISARIKKPQYVKVTSHGGLLTQRMARGLLDSGLKKLKISIHSLDPQIYRDIMGLELAKILRNIDRFLELKKQGGYRLPRLEIVTVDSAQTHDGIGKMKRYWQDRDIKLYIEVVENRANQQSIRESAISAQTMKFFSWCRRLMEQIYVLHDGRVVQCCADWEQHSIMGDLTKEGLEDIWYGQRYTDFRNRFAAGNVKGMICARCFKQSLHN
mgnify:CR=1 FL=1